MNELPLTRYNRILLARAFADVPRVDISIECVLEDQMGSAYVDDVDNPAFFMIDQGGFFVYFAGDLNSSAGHAFIKNMPAGRMLMSGSEGWHDAVQAVFDSERLRPITRYSYSSDSLSLDHLNQLAQGNSHIAGIKLFDVDLINSGIRYFDLDAFESAEDFVQRGIGYAMMQDDTIIGIAYSSLVNTRAIEVSIVVEEEHRKKGIATALAAKLLVWCLERRLHPNWDAANLPSCGLAEKLGYTSKGEYRAYYLGK